MSFSATLRREIWTLRHWLIAIWISVSILAVPFAHAEILPVKTYTAADGLPQNNINRIVFDSRGFLWFCTIEGLSRFDGYKFTNYGIEQGLPHRNVNDLLETPSGDYWLATSGGLVRFNPAGQRRPLGSHPKNGEDLMFSIIRIEGIEKSDYLFTSLIQDKAGQIWCGSETGLLRLVKKEKSFTLLPTSLWALDNPKYKVESLLADRQNAIWIGSAGKIFQLLPNKAIKQYTVQEGLPDSNVLKLYEDRAGKIWAGTGEGLLELEAAAKPGALLVKQTIAMAQGLPGKWVRDIWQASDGMYWVATDRGLCKFSLAVNGQPQRLITYTKTNGLSDYYIKRVIGDMYGNLWVGTANAGAMKLVIDGFTSFGYEAGIPAVNSIFTNRAGELFCTGYVPLTSSAKSPPQAGPSANATAFTWQLSWMKQDRFLWLRPNIPSTIQFSYGWNQISFQDSQGEWWFATQAGLFRFPRPARFEDLLRIKPKAVYNTQNGLSNNNVTRLFEDAKGDIWIASSSAEKNSLDRWERATERLYHPSQMKGMEALNNRPISSFAEDRSGNLWLGLSSNIVTGGVVRYRDGAINFYNQPSEPPNGNVYALYPDATGQLWIASTIDGVSRIDDPNAAQPKLIQYSTANGLSSNRVTNIVEDNYGRMYFGTGNGVDQLEQKSGKIRHFSHADGLPLGSVDDILRDSRGDLWFATTQGLSKFTPKPDPPASAPVMLIDSLRVRGEPRPISALGEVEITLPPFSYSDNQIEIEYVGLSFAPGESLNYQCKLEGAENEWRAQTKQRSLNFANLAPGNYRFLVRAINADGEISATPASVSFRIMAPFYRRWWFIALGLILMGGIVYAAYRYRVGELLQLERMRMRIATDLHDEVGSSLSQIAILSEVARQRLQPAQSSETAGASAAEPMEKVATTSREALDAMSDLVWAINPERDQLSDLSQRMRRFASDTLSAQDITLHFHAPQQEIHLDAEVRRQVFLIFKECINNIARHANATVVEVEFTMPDHYLSLRIKDNGRGLGHTVRQPGQNGGNGLLSMRRRAVELGGTLAVSSANGNGTLVQLESPLHPRQKK